MGKYNLSKYVKVFDDISEDIILYNTKNRAIVAVPVTFKLHNSVENILSESELEELERYDYFDSSTIKEQQTYNSIHSCIISIETMLACNLACPYCYQIGGKKKTIISDESLKDLYLYLENAWNQVHFENLVVKILGGEPTLLWPKAMNIIKDFVKLAENLKCHFQLMIDTNGTNVKCFESLGNLHSILFTIPLTFKKCHDKVRQFPNGNGTYDDIIKNINLLKQILPQSDIVIRYNVDKDNIQYFADFVIDIVAKLKFRPIISPNYTMNLGNGEFINSLNHYNYIEWLSTECIDILAQCNMPIMIAPFSLKERCQHWLPYSLKLFSDGTVGTCAMGFFNENRPTISELLTKKGKLTEFWNVAKTFSVFSDKKCKDCPALFLCGGAYHQPCIKSLHLEECVNGENLHLNIKEFLRRYIKYANEGKEKLFVGFNSYDIYK